MKATDFFTREELSKTTAELNSATLSFGMKGDMPANRRDRFRIKLLNVFLPKQFKIRLTTPREALMALIDDRIDSKTKRMRSDLEDYIDESFDRFRDDYTPRRKK